MVPSNLETSPMNKDQLTFFEQIGNDFKKMRSEYQAFKKMRSEYQAQVIDRSLVPKKMMTKKMMGDFELHILCMDLSRAGGILTNNFHRHGAVRCRKAKQRGELDWWVDNLHDEQWLDHFLFTHGVVVDIVLYVILMYFALLWAYVFLLLFNSAYWHIRAGSMAYGRMEYQSRGAPRLLVPGYLSYFRSKVWKPATNRRFGNRQPEPEIVD